MDVDGVLTDGGMYYAETGDELKKFNTRDGQGLALLREAGLLTAIVTRERTEIVTRRAAKLRISEVHQGVLDKLAVVKDLLARHGIAPEDACYIGDDIGDLDVLRFVGLPVAVRDAMRSVRDAARLVTRTRGGEGAVREVCELILAARSEQASRDDAQWSPRRAPRARRR